jgi:hypothetical protein
MFTPWDNDKEIPSPVFINKLGTKWWLDPSSTDYLHNEDVHGTRILDANVFFTETRDASRARVIVYKDQVVHESQSLEATGRFIDIMKRMKRDGTLDK